MAKKGMGGQTAIILGAGAVGLGLVLLPGFFRKGEAAADTGPLEPTSLTPAVLPPADVTPIVDRDEERKDKPKAQLRAKGLPSLSVTAGRSGVGSLNRGTGVPVGSHMKAGDVDVWNANEVRVDAKWNIQNPTSRRLPIDFRLRLRMARDMSTWKFLTAKTWGGMVGRDKTMYEYVPGKGIQKDVFFDGFDGMGVRTSHGASMRSKPKSFTISPGATATVWMGLILPGPAQSEELREFWEGGPEFNFLVAPYQGNLLIAQHEFKDAFSTKLVRPKLRALDRTGYRDSPKLTIRGR